jgi:hypothetical protein
MRRTRRREGGAEKSAESSPRPDLIEERLQPDTAAEGDAVSASYLRVVYLVLATIVVLATAVTIVLPDVPIVDRFGANLATETLGILLTVVFVHRFLDLQDRARRLRASVGALRKGRRALDRIVTTWAALLKGVHRPNRPPPATLNGLFADHVTEDLRYCNPFAERPAEGEDGSESWVAWAAHNFASAQRSLGEIIVTYGASLDPGYVEVLDEIVDDPFLLVIGELAALPPDARAWRVRLNTARALREAHFERLLRTIRLHNRLATEAATVRTRSGAPRSSALGVGLALDADLRVRSDVDEWWRLPPESGALRVEGPG